MTLSLFLANGSDALLSYGGFIGIVLVLLALDLGVFHRKAHTPTVKSALGWTAVWISIAMLFAVAVYFLYEHHWMHLGLHVPVVGKPGETMVVEGAQATKLYITSYLVEKSLSMDNVFVIAMIFASLKIPGHLQHRVLFWGILGALIMRGVMIGIGAKMIESLHWIVYVFGGLLIFSALRMAFSKEDSHDVAGSRLVRAVGRVVPVTHELHEQHFFTRIAGKLHATPLLVALVVVEFTDLMFAVDSIPAVFAITGDPFIVFTSNIMAILGLRSLYFCLASVMGKFRYLKVALIAVLLFVGIKMCLVHTDWKVAPDVSLAVVLGLLASGIVASLVVKAPEETPMSEGILPDRRVGAPREPVEAGPDAGAGAPERPQAGGPWGVVRAAWRSNRTLRRVSVLIAGSVVILTGIVISPLPGPGLSILGPLGIAILASEFLWARQVGMYAVRRERSVRVVVDRVMVRFPRILVIPAVGLLWVLAWLLSEHTPIPTWALGIVGVFTITPLCYIVYRWFQARSARRRELRAASSGVGGA